MADQGLIGKQKRHVTGMRWCSFAHGIQLTPAQDATITGTTKIAGVLTGGIEVYLMWRPTMQVIDKTISAADGTYTFNNVPRHATYLAVFFKNNDALATEDDMVYSQINTV